VIFPFGATADLAKQIENGAPFDVFLAGDVTNVERLEKQGLLSEGSRAVYARGKLVLWVPGGSRLQLQRIEDITGPEFERIAIPKPDIAPYGKAAVETLQAVKLWEQIQPKIVYGQNASQAKQFVATGNAEVAFIPLSLVKTGEGRFLEVDPGLHQPIDQGLAVIKNSANQLRAIQFVEFMLSPDGQQILVAKGYRASQ
jgi:molybdate transport system substrate-binding protein